MCGEDLLLAAKKFEKNLLNFFWRSGVSYDRGEDLVQETYLRLWNYRQSYQPTAKLSTFLFLMARQVLLDAARVTERRIRREEAWVRERPQTAEPTAFGAKEDVRWALAQLPEPQREVVTLAVLQDIPYAQISQKLNIPEGTVKSRMFNALKKLRKIFYAAVLLLAVVWVVWQPPGQGVRRPVEYQIAFAANTAAQATLIATQRADGSWENDYLTRQNAAALREAQTAESRLAYRRAVRYLRSKGLEPLSQLELRLRSSRAEDWTKERV